MFDRTEIIKYICDELEMRSIRYEVHNLAAASMIDIWKGASFYVVQIESNALGLSKIDKNNPGFDTKPDEVYLTKDNFIAKFQSILNSTE